VWTLPGIEDIPLQNFLGWLLAGFLLMWGLDRSPRKAAEDGVPIVMLTWVYASQRAGSSRLLRRLAGRPLGRHLHGRSRGAMAVAMLEPAAAVARRASPAVLAGTTLAVGLAAHTAVNLRLLRRPAPAARVTERVSVLVPARNEARQLATTLAGILASTGVDDLQVLVLDDGSTDGTGEVARAIPDRRLTVLDGGPGTAARLAGQALGLPAPGGARNRVRPGVRGCGRPACTQCAGGNRPGDARRSIQPGLPVPRQLAESALERLVQPLVTWSWVATLPLGWAERSLRPSLSAANGQLLAIDAQAYRRSMGMPLSPGRSSRTLP
jgi:hypothetical protein